MGQTSAPCFVACPRDVALNARTAFFSGVFAAVTRTSHGRVTVDCAIARTLGRPRGGRVVGWAMRIAPEHQDLLGHRVDCAAYLREPPLVYDGALDNAPPMSELLQ